MNEALQKAGKKPILIKLADEYLSDDDLIQNATSKKEYDKFRALVAIFQKYAAQYCEYLFQ